MGFLDVSVINASIVSKGTNTVAAAQQAIASTYTTPSTTAVTSVSTALAVTPSVVTTPQQVATGTTNPTLTTSTAVATPVVNSSVTPSSTVSTSAASTNALQSTATKLLTSVATNYLQSAIKSLTGTFSSSPTSLAKGISPLLSNIFGETNVASASTTTSLIADPVTANLINAKTPGSTAFKIDSAAAGSQTVSTSGTSSIFGSGASSMVGINLSTLLNRFNLDSPTNLGTTLTSSFASSQVSALFSPLIKDASGIVSSAVGGGTLGSTLGKLTSVTLASALGVKQTGTVSSSTVNELSSFLGTTNSLATATGNTSLVSYYTPNTSYSLVNQAGTPVSTNGSGVDASTANAILELLSLAGCSTTTTNYTSATQQASLFNTGLSFASINGMSTEVNDLLGCSHAGTPSGQYALVSAFTASAGSQLGISSQLISGITSPSVLNTPYISSSILTNPYLNATDTAAVNNLFTTMGTTTQDAFSIGNTASNPYPIYDASLLSQAQPSFVDGVFGDSTITDYYNSSELTMQPDGSFSVFG